MISVSFAFISGMLVLGGALGIRMIRDEQAIASLFVSSDASSESKRERLLFSRMIDIAGLKTQRALRRAYGPSHLQKINSSLRSAGNPEGLTLDLFVQREAGFITLSAVLLLFLTLLGHPVYGLVVFLVFSGWMYLWLFVVLRKRRADIDRNLPDFLDVLAVTVRAGLPFRSALERVCQHFDGPLAEEMSKTLQEMKLGVSRRDAFTATRERCRSSNVDTFVSTLLQSEELGTPIGDALDLIVREIRRERAEQVRRAAAKTAPKVSLIASTTMLPGTMVLMVGAIFYANREALSRIFGG